MKQLIDPFDYGGAMFRVGLVRPRKTSTRNVYRAYEAVDVPDFETGLRDEFDACVELRFDSYCKAKHPLDNKRFDPGQFPDKREVSPEDDHSHHFLATKEVNGILQPVGTFRLIPCDMGFYVQDTKFGGKVIRLPDQHNGRPVSLATTYEAGRWVGHWTTAPEGRRKVLLSMMLLEAGMRFTQAQGRAHWFCVIDEVNAGRLRHTGWILNQLIPGVHDYLTVPSEACLMPMETYSFPCPRLGGLVKT